VTREIVEVAVKIGKVDSFKENIFSSKNSSK
jgi:hypothetical protein